MSVTSLPTRFHRIQAAAGDERRRLLAELRARDAAAATELEGMLAAAEREGTVLDQPAWSPAAKLGAYRVVREIGRGGMGRVFLAEQEGDGFTRPVALKLLDGPELGERGVQRFRIEQRILASLEHPGIARFYDGGQLPGGRWFLALEYVEGADLLGFATARALSIDARARLFLGVLEAVQYAHTRLVVHRDLKPANIMVGADGRPRLLDFGISKLLGPDEGGDDAPRTELGAMTPAYASPEQLRGERVTAASDVYSLGVVFYELVAGRRPFRGDTPRALERAVLEDDAPPPSTIVRAHADLDAIVLKALRKLPAERYASAEAFAEDLQRFLAGHPVLARRGGRRYRFGKLVRRHRLAVTAATAAAVALVAGLGLAVWQRGEAVESRDRAERRFSDVEGLARTMLFEVHDGVQRLPDSAGVRAVIADRALAYLERLRSDAGDEPTLLASLADGYERVGVLYAGGVASQELPGHADRGRNALEQAVAIRRRLLARTPGGQAERLALARVLEQFARCWTGPDMEPGRVLMREAVELQRALFEASPERTDLAYLHARALIGRLRVENAYEPGRTGDESVGLDDAAAAWIALIARTDFAIPDDPMFGQDAAFLAYSLYSVGRDGEAGRIAEHTIAACEPALRARRDIAVETAVQLAYRTLAFCRLRGGRAGEALAFHDREMAIRRTQLSDRERPMGTVINFFQALLDEAMIAGAVPDVARAEHALDEADRFLPTTGWKPAYQESAHDQVDAYRTELYTAAAAATTVPAERERFRRLAAEAVARSHARGLPSPPTADGGH